MVLRGGLGQFVVDRFICARPERTIAWVLTLAFAETIAGGLFRGMHAAFESGFRIVGRPGRSACFRIRSKNILPLIPSEERINIPQGAGDVDARITAQEKAGQVRVRKL